MFELFEELLVIVHSFDVFYNLSLFMIVPCLIFRTTVKFVIKVQRQSTEKQDKQTIFISF